MLWFMGERVLDMLSFGYGVCVCVCVCVCVGYDFKITSPLL
jgi:hypothetical protein